MNSADFSAEEHAESVRSVNVAALYLTLNAEVLIPVFASSSVPNAYSTVIPVL